MHVIARCCWVSPLAFHVSFQMTALDLALESLAGSRGRRFLYIVDCENALTRNVKSIHDVYRACHIETAEAAAHASFVLVFRGGSAGTFSRPDLSDVTWRNLGALAMTHPELKVFVCFDERRGFAPKRRGRSECFDSEPGPPSHEKCSIDDAFIVYTALCGSCLFDHIGIVSADVDMFADLHGYLNQGHRCPLGCARAKPPTRVGCVRWVDGSHCRTGQNLPITWFEIII